jgi:hypothetical protein
MDHQAFAQLLGNYGEFVGAIAVVVTLGYLATQVKQNTRSQDENRRAVIAESERGWFSSWHEILRSSLGSKESVAIMRKGLNHYETMDADEKGVFSVHMICLCDYADVLRRLHEKGFVTDDVLNPVMSNLLGFIVAPGGAAWWSKVGPVLTIFDYMESLDKKDAPDILDVMDYFRLDPSSDSGG